MPIILENLRMDNCDIAVDVGDTANQGKAGQLEIFVEGKKKHERVVSLFDPPQTEKFLADKDGKTHSVKAVLSSGNEKLVDREILIFCSS